MTTLILWAGFSLAAASAWAVRRPEWRVPALLFVILALPGNVDNLLPQMLLDLHSIPNNTAPVVSVVDLLILWACLLTWREGGLRRLSPTDRQVLLAGFGVALLAGTTAMLAILHEVDAAAGVRGMVMFARIPALLFIVLALRVHLRAGALVGFGAAGGLLSLLANGIYTSGAEGLTRFTAATVGRNGFAMALVACALICAGAGFQAWKGSGPTRRMWSGLMLALAAAALFAAIATGTRMALLALFGVLALALLVNRTWLSRTGVVRVATVAAAMVLVAIAAAMWTSEGGRALGVLTDPGETADIVFNAGDGPSYSEVRTRTHFWDLAVEMAGAHPLTGVGPFQWNIERYQVGVNETIMVVDVHNTYLQVAAEYGLVVTVGYVALLALLLGRVLLPALRRGSPIARQWDVTLLTMAAVLYPMTELTNSHFFNVRLGAFGWLLLAVAFAMATAIDAGQPAGEGLPAVESA